MPAPILSRRDLEFLLYEWLDVTALCARERFAEHSRETFDAVLDLSADLAAARFRSHNKKSDATEPVMHPDGTVVLIDDIKKALDDFAAAGMIAGQFDEDLGGSQLPVTIARASLAWFQAANAATTSYPFLTIANANLLVEYGTEEQIETYVRPMLAGRYSGTMCLSEPQAGSSLADITTTARPAGDGTYRVTGTKMWISGGDHELTENIVHLVLAKIPGGGPGVEGISLLLVPKYLPGGARNDVALVGLNHKMGNRGTTNTLLNFGEGRYSPTGEPGAVGYLVGREHRGLSYMFHMMNEARIGVGALATALGYTGYLQSVDYARTRTQGRALGPRNPGAAPVALIEHADVKRMLLAQKSYVQGALALVLYCSQLVDEQKTAADPESAARAQLLLEVLTPIAKSWPSQWCLLANSLAIQVHGGYGYTREYDVEQFYRDNRLNPIHEGTHGIQGLDLLGRKVVANDSAGLKLLLGIMAETLDQARARSGEIAGYAKELQAFVDRLGEVTATLWSDGDPALALANSSVYLEAAGHVVIAWIWLEQLLVVGDRRGDFYNGKRIAAQYFFAHELPTVAPRFDLLAGLDRTTLDAHPDWF
ncbi:acyl-CoA dehydrogenase [Nocardia jinanensis]|uniref:Acyl-CoA dehydrogenase n=1 Tax=Nocardia jinanensis TaxID=382504 RepID=A0A917VRH4_9NOCA|nr:acyl-CoA dehydrogenase [Nocardia jinanensis]GGL11463.1 acyl-CoA dehydrogenase [Nocardia jinanensis]